MMIIVKMIIEINILLAWCKTENGEIQCDVCN